MTQLNKQQNSEPDSNCGLVLPDSKAYLIFWLVFICGIFLDLYSKKIIFNWLHETGSFTIINGFLSLVMAENTGAAFGIAAGKRFLLVGTSAIALVGVIVIFLFGHIRHRLVQLALALFAAGVAGNLYDRIFNDGRVRDFIDVIYWPGVHWPAFNLADSMLCISVALLIISTLRTPPKRQVD